MLEAGPALGRRLRSQRRGAHSFSAAPGLFERSDAGAFEYMQTYVPMDWVPAGQLGSRWGEARSAEPSADHEAFQARWLRQAAKDLLGEACGVFESETNDPQAAARGWAYPHSTSLYDDYFQAATRSATVLLETQPERIDLDKKSVWLEGQALSFDVILNTDPLDDLFGQCYGPLSFLGCEQRSLVLPVPQAYPEGVHCSYHPGETGALRVTEFRKFNQAPREGSLLGVEQLHVGGRQYALPIVAEQRRAQRYLAELPQGVYSIGPLGRYAPERGVASEVQEALSLAQRLGLARVA